MLTGWGIKSCINRPNTHWKRRSGWQRGFIQAKDSVHFQWFCFSVERYERLYKLQDTIPQHCGESTTSRRFECILLLVWKKNPHPPWTPLHTTINTSSNPPLPHTCTENKWRWRVAGLHKEQKKTVCHQPALNPVLTSYPPSSHRYSTDHWSCAKSPHASNAPPSSPSQRNPKLLDLMTTDPWL